MRECSRVLALTLWICLIKKKKKEEEKRTLELSLCNEVWIKTVVIFCITAKINTFIHCIWTVLMTTKKALWGCMSCVGTAGILHLWLALGRLGCWDTTVGITCPRGHILTQRGLMTLLCVTLPAIVLMQLTLFRVRGSERPCVNWHDQKGESMSVCVPAEFPYRDL